MLSRITRTKCTFVQDVGQGFQPADFLKRQAGRPRWTIRTKPSITTVRKNLERNRNMYAIFEDGSRQYRVQEGDVVKVDYRDAQIGSSIEFNRVLLLQQETDTKIGQPTVNGARVVAEVVEMTSTKIYVQHFKRRKNIR